MGHPLPSNRASFRASFSVADSLSLGTGAGEAGCGAGAWLDWLTVLVGGGNDSFAATAIAFGARALLTAGAGRVWVVERGGGSCAVGAW